jgi:hypothetical protein
MPEAARSGARLHPVNRHHLAVLTDEVGIMQHAIGSRPDPAHGYCVDDVARALQVDLLHQHELGWAAVAEHAWRSIRFLRDAFDDATGRFRNFRSVDGSWLAGRASEDSQARAMLALGETIAMAPDPRMVEAAEALFEEALPEAVGLTYLRAQASVALGCDAAMRTAPSEDTARALRLLAGRIRATFGDEVAATGRTRSATPDAAWPWPEPCLTYENALPVRALIVVGRYLGSERMVDAGLARLDWLIDVQIAPDGHFSPIGNGWWPRDGEKSRFDQQPIEASALLLAAEAAFEVTGYERYRDAMEVAYAWFLGGNDLGIDVADPATGAGHDGLTPHGVNLNQGAESTLMWLTALEHIRALRSGRVLLPPAAIARTARAEPAVTATDDRPLATTAR